MNRLLLPALVGAALATSPAWASDSRLVEREYDPGQVVRIDARTTVQATIAFGDSELIENVAIGDSHSWQVTPNKRANLLFVKPLKERTSTNMTVVTNLRTYLFDLVANPKADPLYVLRFSYPEEAAGKAASALAEGPNDLEMTAASDPYAVKDPARLNFEWGSEGDAKLLPARTYDDGEATFLTWQAGKPVPAILITNEDGLEGPVNYAVRGDTVVVDGVPGEIILRSGRNKAVLIYQGPVRNVSRPDDAALARAGGIR